MTRYIDWDYDTKIATEYERIGECNQCGDCCKNKKPISFIMIDGSKTSYGGSTTNGEGRWSEIDDGEKKEFVRFYIGPKNTRPPCDALDSDNRCGKQLLGKKPWICSVWPTAPSDIEPFENCSYQFVEIDKWNLEETDNINLIQEYENG